MKIFDRLTGRRLSELPATLLPGRYCVLEPFILNGHSSLQSGDLLLDDGSGVIRTEDSECQFDSLNLPDEEQTESELAEEAIIAIAGKISYTNNANVSPMLPSEMAAQCSLQEVEKNLTAILRDGHLHSISDRPRRDLRYDDLVSPVARARRLATSALSHLASHSDCWQQRTLSGVQPRKVLARFSEDDYAIYENRLYKRLLDRLDRHLAKRLARIRSVNLRLEKALEFQDSEQTHFRLRQDICKLWGESYLDDNTGMQLEAGKLAAAELESQLRAIRGLKQHGLYKQVPATSVVPSQVHRTNILNHDPHYRHLPPLWEKLKDDREERQLTPEERLEKHRLLQIAYSSYVGLVLRRALERYGLGNNSGKYLIQWGGQDFSLRKDGHDWVLENDRTSLKFIPVAWFGSSIIDGQSMAPGHILCRPGTQVCSNSSKFLPISPLDLYVVERVGRIIDQWLVQQLLEGYGHELGPLPSPAKRLTENWADQFQSVSPTRVRLLAPLDAQQTHELKESLQASANTEVQEMFFSAIDKLNALARLCGHEARFNPNLQQDFYCQCGSCQTTWSLKTVENKRLFSKRPKGASSISSEDGFDWSGRDWLGFEVGDIAQQ